MRTGFEPLVMMGIKEENVIGYEYWYHLLLPKMIRPKNLEKTLSVKSPIECKMTFNCRFHTIS